MARLRLLGRFLQSCVLGLAVLGLRRSLARWQLSPLHEDRFGFGEGDAAVAVVELENADLAVFLGDHERAIRLETWRIRTRICVPDC